MTFDWKCCVFLLCILNKKIKILKNSIANCQVLKGCVRKTFPPQILFITPEAFSNNIKGGMFRGGGVKK